MVRIKVGRMPWSAIVVDDEPMVLGIAKKALERHG